MFGFLLAMQVSRGETYTTSDGVGAAVWAPPGRWQLDPGTMAGVRERFIAIFGGNLARAVETYGVLDASHPAEPHHWYLATLGTHPDWQGQGIGTALIQPVLERADAEGVPAYLESSKESNLAYYARFGFDVIGKIDVPDGGPTLWPMWREPRSH
jgi:GNAT superfamily N-acetyltransferase